MTRGARAGGTGLVTGNKESFHMIGVGVIGYGYWGPNLVRNFAAANECNVVMVCDSNPDRLAALHKHYPAIRLTTEAGALIADPAVDVVVVATPVSSHYELALRALEAGKHVLVEKPLTSSAEQARRLIEQADRRGLILMVDHTFIYTGAVRKIKELIDEGHLGDIYYFDSTRNNLGLFQQDVNVIWDLAVHDLSIMSYVIPARPTAVSATGLSHVPGKPENIAFLTVFYDEPIIAHISVNWLSPVKVRQTLISGNKKMIVYNDIEPSEKIKVYDKGIDLIDRPESRHKLLVSYRSGDMHAPRLDTTEALALETSHFMDCIARQKQPLTDGPSGLRVVQILEAATRSIAEHGRQIILD